MRDEENGRGQATGQEDRILITVKTYPTLSKKYTETVCTAGVRQDGTWVRIYPVPFRRLPEWQRFQKYDWVDCKLIKNVKDRRPESFRPVAGTGFKTVGHMSTEDQWRERRALLLERVPPEISMGRLIQEAKAFRLKFPPSVAR